MRHILLYTFLGILSISGIPLSVSALTVSPARVEITGDPGTTIYGEIEVFNEQEGTKTFFTSFENFEPSGDSGAPRFVGAKDGLATWLKAEDTLVLDSAKSKIVPFSITIPQNAEPGGYFAAVFFGSQPPKSDEAGQVSVGGKIGVLVLLRVSGYVEEKAGLSEFSTKNDQRFFSMIPISFTYKVNNSGGDRIAPTGDVYIKNNVGFTSTTFLANKNQGNVLPGSTRKFEATWTQDGQSENALGTMNSTTTNGFFASAAKQWEEFHFGWYTAHMKIAWGTGKDQVAQASYNFFIIPWQLLIIIGLILIVIWFIGKKGLKKYNAWIISKATAGLNTTQPPTHTNNMSL